MVNNQYQQIVPFIVFIFALLLFFELIKPVITILLSSILIAYVAYPFVQRIHNKIKSQSISIIGALAIIVFIALIPFLVLAFLITQQAFYFYHSFSTNIDKGALFGVSCTSDDSTVCLLLNQAERFSVDTLSTFGLNAQVQSLIPVIESWITQLFISIPLVIAQVFLVLIISFYILQDWKHLLNKIVDLLPLRKKTVDRLIAEFGNISHTVIYAQLFVACIQGIVSMIGFYIFGVPFPILFGVITAFFALIPNIGTALIWIPASLYLMIGGYFSTDYWMLAKGIGLFIYGLCIISTIDNILLARIVHAKAKVSPIIVIIGVIGGASMFGLVGIFIGPILLPLLITYFQTFKDRLLHPKSI
jgi:predicted PurR-regulated permease PerM